MAGVNRNNMVFQPNSNQRRPSTGPTPYTTPNMACQINQQRHHPTGPQQTTSLHTTGTNMGDNDKCLPIPTHSYTSSDSSHLTSPAKPTIYHQTMSPQLVEAIKTFQQQHPRAPLPQLAFAREVTKLVTKEAFAERN